MPDRVVHWNSASSIPLDIVQAAAGRAGLGLARLAGLSSGGFCPRIDAVGDLETIFRPIRRRRMRVLVIASPDVPPPVTLALLKTWRAYFPRSQIEAAVPWQCSPDRGWRIDVFKAGQTDRKTLEGIARAAAGLDIVIDSGSRLSGYQIRAFEILFPLLAPGGLYLAQGTASSYDPAFGGGAPGTTTNALSALSYFRGLIECLAPGDVSPLPAEHARLARHVRAVAFLRDRVLVAKTSTA